eukprot:gene25848-31042_t
MSFSECVAARTDHLVVGRAAEGLRRRLATYGVSSLQGRDRVVGDSEPEMFDVIDRFVEKHRHMIVVQAVHDVAALPRPRHQPHRTQQSQLMRDSGLLHPHRLHQVTHRTRPVPQPSQHPQSTRRRQRLQRGSHRRGRLRIELRGRCGRAFDSVTHVFMFSCIVAFVPTPLPPAGSRAMTTPVRSDPHTEPAAPRAATAVRTRPFALPEVRWAAIATGLFVLGLAAQFGGAPTWLWWTLYLGCYVTGGWEPALAGLQALREKTLDVDLLMIVAAIGAAAI